MVAERSLEPFADNDGFLRRVSNRKIRGGIVSPGAFTDKHETLSFTFQSEVLRTPEGLTQYQIDKALPSCELPGICKLTFLDLMSLNPPLPPREDPDLDDDKYGHLHCSTDQPTDLQRDVMAKCAEAHTDAMLELVRKKDRTDEG